MNPICMRQTAHILNLMMMINIGDNIMMDLWDVLCGGVFYICLPLMYNHKQEYIIKTLMYESIMNVIRIYENLIEKIENGEYDKETR